MVKNFFDLKAENFCFESQPIDFSFTALMSYESEFGMAGARAYGQLSAKDISSLSNSIEDLSAKCEPDVVGLTSKLVEEVCTAMS